MSFPPRATAVWIEQGNAISGQIAPPVVTGDVDLPLVPAGSARIGGPRRTVRLIHAGAVPFSRIVTDAASVRMPEGTTLALEIDVRGDVAQFAIDRIAAAKTTAIDPKQPDSGAALVGMFGIGNVIANHASTFRIDGDREPELVIDRGDELIALWRSLDAGQSELTLRSDAYQFSPMPVRLRANSVATIRGELRPLPSLTVRIIVPENARDAWRALEPSISVRRTADKKVVRTSDGGDREFTLLPLDSYEVALTAKPWTFLRRADLTSGVDAAVEFDLKPFTISGTVSAGSDAKAATVAFRRGNGDATTVRTNANGDYEATLWTGGMYIVEAVPDDGSEQPPFARLYRLSSSRRLDIDVPRTKVLVSVTDSVSGKPVANAAVNTINRWEDPDTGKGGASHNATTDDSGVARLAPLSEGTAEIHVTADGYFKDEPITIAVQSDTVRTVPVQLRPAGAGVPLRVTLPGGAPAADAELLVVGSPNGMPVLWSGRTDAQGHLSVPRTLTGSILLLRHPAAASHARRFEESSEQEIQFTPLSPPLMIRAERRGEPARSASITIWFGALPISGPALQFLTRSQSSTSAAGDWVGQHLPQGSLRILASSGRIDAQIAAGIYDALAATVPEPRPNQFVIAVIE